jgi:transposase-like protein
MGTTSALEELRAGITGTRRDGQGHRRYGDALKQQVRQYARERVRAGGSVSAIADELGISGDTLWGWLNKIESSGARHRGNALPERAREFRAALAALGPRAPTTTYPPELRILGLAHLKERRDAGASFREVAAELGVGNETLRNWIRPRRRRSSAVRPVSIASRAVLSAALVVHGPAGVRIEGLDVAAVAALLKELS